MASVSGSHASIVTSAAAVGHDASGSHGNPGSDPLGLSSTTFAGGSGSGTVVASQNQSGGNTVLHLHDGSTITIVGTTHIDASFFQ